MITDLPRLFRRRSLATLVATLSILAVACGSDDGAAVTDLGASDSEAESESASASDSGSASGSGSASASGLSEEDLAVGTDNPLVLDAVAGYRTYVQEQIDELIAETGVFADLVRAGDIAGAKDHYQISRRPWERIEPIAGLIEDIDGAVDSRADDGLSPTDPEFTGWHRLEYHLWVLEDVSDAGPFADQLEADLGRLAAAAPTIDLPPGVLTVGAQELIEEVAAPDGKLSGEEERYSGTDLYAFQANVEGAEALIDLLDPALAEADPDLLAGIRADFAELYDELGQFGSFEAGFVNYGEVTDEQRSELAAILGTLAEKLSLLNGTLGLA